MDVNPIARARILVVDDEDIVLNLVSDTLGDEGYEIITTSSPDQAIELAGREPFDFLLTDIRMPTMNGIELARVIRGIIPAVGVIFMTGYANLDTAKQAIKEGAYDYIMKPFELNEIRQAISRAVEKKESDTSAALSQQLNRIADLSNIMYSSGDLASLLKLSLSFALVQSKAKAGLAVYFDKNNNEIAIMSQGGPSLAVQEITCVQTADTDFAAITDLDAPCLLRDIARHPLANTTVFNRYSDVFLPKELYSLGVPVIVPLRRAEKMIGYISLFHDKSDDGLACADTQFLNFISSQLAISLENLQLLDESRDAYQRLEYLQDQTIQMEKMATRGQMAAEIGHELNNYLGVVVANFQLMNARIQKGVIENLDRFTKSIEDHLDKISRFTKSLMDYSSMKETRFELIDINALLYRIIEFLRPQKRFRQFEIAVRTEAKELEVEIDQGLIEQVIYNFMNNAADASAEAPTKRIEVSTSRLPGETVRLSIKDFGVGIEESRLKRLFKEKFTTKTSGHGIGLIVCKGIIDKHHGSIQAVSRRGQGAEFIITLPLRQENTEKTQSISIPVGSAG